MLHRCGRTCQINRVEKACSSEVGDLAGLHVVDGAVADVFDRDAFGFERHKPRVLDRGQLGAWCSPLCLLEILLQLRFHFNLILT